MAVCLALTSDVNDERAALEARAAEAFGLLDTSSVSSQESDSLVSRLLYVLPRIFVEVELDWQEEALFVLVGALVDGKVPDGYYVDGGGQKVRWHLSTVLASGGRLRNSQRLQRATKKSGYQAMLDQIAVFAEELESAISDLPALIHNVERG